MDPKERRAEDQKDKIDDFMEGEHCDRCGQEIFRVNWVNAPSGKLKLCNNCVLRINEIWLEIKDCPKCNGKCVLVTKLNDGLMDTKITCPQCGTFEYVGSKKEKGKSRYSPLSLGASS